MMKSLDKLADILDEHIEKGLRFMRKPKTRVEAIEQDLMKSLSFDPFSPVEMHDQSQFYNPYLQHPSGGYMPYPDTYWSNQTESVNIDGHTYSRPRHSEGYETVREFYSIVNDRDPENPRAIHPLFQGRLLAEAPLESQSRFAQFRKSYMDIVMKGMRVPVGHVHVAPDGRKYKKVGEGKWAPVADKQTRDFHADPDKHAKDMEQSAGQKYAIEQAIKQKMQSQKIVDEAKNQAVRAAAEHTHKMVSGMFDGPMPKELDAAHKEHVKAHGGDEGTRGGTRKLLHQISHNVKPKHHAVEVHFQYNGQEYNHRFPQVEAGNHTEAIERVSQILREKLPGSQVSRIHAESPKEKPEKKPAAEKPKGEVDAKV